MRCVRLWFVTLCLVTQSLWAEPVAPRNSRGFEGVWLGEITGPNERTPFGLAFTPTEKGLLVSVYMPEMFLFGVNFGPATIQEHSFQLPALNLNLTRDGDRLHGTFAPGALPVELKRGGSFSDEPPVHNFPAAPAPKWIHELGAPAWATPVARDGIVYVGTTDGRFHAVRADNGENVWRWDGTTPLYGEALATLEHIFFVDENGVLVCLLRRDGTLKWQTPVFDPAVTGPLVKNETFNHRAVAPVIDAKGILYVGSADGGVYAVKSTNGKKLWRHETKSRIHAPVVLAGDDLVIGGFDGTVLVLDRGSRKEKMRTKLGGPIASAAVVSGDSIVVGCRDYFLYALARKTGRILWRDSFWFSWIESTPRLADGRLYVGGSDFRRVSAIDPATGRRLWATDVGGLSWGSPVVEGESVYAGTVGQMIEGTVIKHAGGIVALNRGTGEIRWRYGSPAADHADFTGFAGSLVMSNGALIGATVTGQLIAFPIEAPTR